MNRPATLLGQIIHDRMTDLGRSLREVEKVAASKGFQVSHVTVADTINRTELKRFYKEKTLRAIAAGIDYPFEVLHEAAREKFYDVDALPMTLKTAGTTILVARAHQELDDDAREQHVRMTERFTQLTQEQRDELEALATKYTAALAAERTKVQRRRRAQ